MMFPISLSVSRPYELCLHCQCGEMKAENCVFPRGYKEVKQEVAACIGYVGSTMGQDMPGLVYSVCCWLHPPCVVRVGFGGGRVLTQHA